MGNAFTSKKTIGNIVKVVFSNLIKLFVSVLIGFLLPKMISMTDYGYYKTFTLYSVYVGALHFGFADGVYLLYGGKDYHELEKGKFRFFASFFIGMELIMATLVGLVAFFFLEGELRFIFLCLVFFLIPTNVIDYYRLISQITGRFNEFSLSTIIQSIFCGIAILVLWFLSKYTDTTITYRYYTVINICISCFIMLWYLYAYRDITFGKRAKCGTKEIFNLFKTGFPLLFANLCTTFIFVLDRQVVNIFFDTETYAVYAFAYNILALATTSIQAISTVVFPTLMRSEEETKGKTYSFLSNLTLILVFTCLLIYYPLCAFIKWFLPQYTDSLVIFRIILPGLATNSVISIVIHNYYKANGKELSYFIKSVIILVLSLILNFVAYLLFRTTIAISWASIIALLVWYVLANSYFVKEYRIQWFKPLVYICLSSISFYLVTTIANVWGAMGIYFVIHSILTVLFYYQDVKRVCSKIFRK